jgi:hypothetical protein
MAGVHKIALRRLCAEITSKAKPNRPSEHSKGCSTSRARAQTSAFAARSLEKKSSSRCARQLTARQVEQIAAARPVQRFRPLLRA